MLKLRAQVVGPHTDRFRHGGARPEQQPPGSPVTVPTGVLTVVTGVAGSGKSSLITADFSVQHPEFTVVGQRPLHGGRRSSLLTVTSVADGLRSLFAASGDLSSSWFSRNAKGGCPECRGTGEITTDLAFMEDTRTPCEACAGTGFNEKSSVRDHRRIHHRRGGGAASR